MARCISRVSDNVRLAGYHADWLREVLDHDLFINLSDTEGFCIVVAEAMAAGLPVVATPVGGIRQYGRDGRTSCSSRRPTPDASPARSNSSPVTTCSAAGSANVRART